MTSGGHYVATHILTDWQHLPGLAQAKLILYAIAKNYNLYQYK
jgi:hypothetical protein